MQELERSTQQVIMETDRLRLVTWRKEDWKEFQKLATDPLVVRYLGTGEPWSDERVHEFVDRQCENWQKFGICLWKLLPKDSDALIGICGLQHLPAGPDVEIGWWLAPAYWGKRLASEAARQVLGYGFGTANLQRIVAIAQSANVHSIRIMEKIGMRFESEAVHKGIRVVIYAITRDMFLARQEQGEQRA